MGMTHRPVCVKCECELKPEKNGVQVVEIVDGNPYQVWDADKWKCPKCGVEIMAGFGIDAWTHRGEAEFNETVQKVYNRNCYVKCHYK
jgi:hypothetical protein